MSITHTVDLNLSNAVTPPILYMAQGDSNSRTIKATLWDGVQPYTIPTGSTAMMRFGKPDGTGGLYDRTENGDAVSYANRVVTIPVAAQVLSVAGVVDAEVDLYGGTSDKPTKLATFVFQILVEKSAYADDTIISSDYYNIIAEQIQKAIESGAKADQAIQAAEDAITAAHAAQNGAIAAEQAKLSAQSAKTEAEQAQTAAEQAKTDAQAAETNAQSSATAAYTSAQNASNSATNATTAKTQAQEAAENAADDAEDAEAWAVGTRKGQPVSSTDPAYRNNAKYYKDQAQGIAGGGVTSFNGRSGSVNPEEGDYTKAMVGLGNVDNTSDEDKPVSTAVQTALDKKQAKITSSGILKGNGSGGVTAAKAGVDYASPDDIPEKLSDLTEDSTHRVVTDVEKDTWNKKADKSVSKAATLTAAGWSNGVQTLAVSGVTASANGSLRIAQSATDEQFAAWGAAQPRVTAQAAGSLTVKAAGAVPAVDIPVEVIVL